MRKRKRPSAQPTVEPAVLIGYVAALTSQELWSEAEAPVVAGSEAWMQSYLGRYQIPASQVAHIASVAWDTLLYGLRHGVAYAFDEDAYKRFYPLARRAGLGVGPEDFSHPPPPGVTAPMIHLVRVQHFRSR